MSIQLPRLMNEQHRTTALLHPTQLSVSLNLTPLSTAKMTLPHFDAAVQTGDLVELYTSTGSAGVFRVQKVERNHHGLRTVYLEHGLVTLADSLISSSGEQEGAPLDIFTQLLAHQDKVLWQLGRVDVPADKLLTWSWDYSNVLESLLSLMKELPDYALIFDQHTSPWTLNIIACDDRAACECRLNRNILSLKVTVDRTELCTRLYIPPPDTQEEDAEPQEHTILDADTQDKWGVVSRSLSGDPGLTQEELLAEGQHYLELHKEPLISVTMDARDLRAASGQSFDSITLGRVCRVCLPAQSEIIRQKVVSIVWPDVFRKPDQITVTLANKTSTAGSILSGLIVDTTVLRKRVTQNWNDLQEQRYILIEAKENITLLSKEIDLLGKDITLHATEILTLRSGIQDNAAQIVLMDGRITANANEIELQAKDIISLRTGVDDNTAAITLANGRIDAQANDIALHANDILTLQSGVGENTAQITLMDGRITANADEIEANAKRITANADEITANAKSIKANAEAISLQASNVITLQAGVDDNKAAIALANGNITALADSISLKADQASLDLANGNIQANANAISLKADKIELEGLVKATDLEVVRAEISNLTAGVTTASTLKAGILNANTTLIVGGEIAGKRQISMGSVTTAGKVLSTGELDLSHSHAVSVDDSGNLQLGGVTAEGSGGNFNIAETQFYKDGVSAAANDVTLSAGSWTNGSITVSASNGKSATVSIPKIGLKVGTWTDANNIAVVPWHGTKQLDGTIMVDGSAVYTKGWEAVEIKQADIIRKEDSEDQYESSTHDTLITIRATATNGATKYRTFRVSGEKAYSAGKTDGADGVTLSTGSWTNGSITVSASNGKSAAVSMPKISLVEGTWTDANNIAVVPWHGTKQLDGTIMVDGTAMYNKGWNACLAECEATIQLYKITQDLTATTLYYADRTAAGTGFARVVAVTDTYFIPDAKT